MTRSRRFGARRCSWSGCVGMAVCAMPASWNWRPSSMRCGAPRRTAAPFTTRRSIVSRRACRTTAATERHRQHRSTSAAGMPSALLSAVRDRGAARTATTETTRDRTRRSRGGRRSPYRASSARTPRRSSAAERRSRNGVGGGLPRARHPRKRAAGIRARNARAMFSVRAARDRPRSA